MECLWPWLQSCPDNGLIHLCAKIGGFVPVNAIGAASYDWDFNGQLTDKPNFDLEYNWDGKLRSGTRVNNGDTIDLKYDPAGNRVYKSATVSSVTTNRKYIVDIASKLPTILCVIDTDTGSLENSYIYAGAGAIAFYDGDWSDSQTGKYFYLHDRLGSVRQVVDSNSVMINTYTYNPFGGDFGMENSETVDNPFKYTGQFWDSEIAQYYLRAHMYDPGMMRFTSRDPVKGKLIQPLTLHKYLYCASDPINRVDITGADSEGPWWTQWEFWEEFGTEMNKGLAAGVDGFIPLPFWYPFEKVYANPDGSVDKIYLRSRLYGSVARSSLLMAGNVFMVQNMMASSSIATATVGQRLFAGAFWKSAFGAASGSKGLSLTWGAATGLLTVAGIVDNFDEILDALF